MAKTRERERRSSRSSSSGRRSAPARAGRQSGGSLDSLLKTGEPAEKFSNLPTGNYEGFVKPGSAKIETKPGSKTDKRAVMMLIVTSPEEFVDRQQRASFDLSTQIGVNIFLAELATLGLGQPDTEKAMADTLEETDKMPVSFWVSEPKDEFPPKVRFNDRLERGSDDGPEEDAPDEPQYTEKEILDMSPRKLKKLAEELKLDPDNYDNDDKLTDAILDELGL
jgi:hypothetical protein